MSGPAASVLLPKPLTGSSDSALRKLIAAVSDESPGGSSDLEDFWVCDTGPAGGGYAGAGRPFAVFTGLQPDRVPEEIAQVAGTFGFMPVDEIVVVAFCNSDDDHRILGELCLWLVEQFGGVVNFDGALWPSLPPESEIDILHCDWRQVEPHFRRMVEGMPGRVASVWYELQDGRQWVIHVGDTDFMRAWLEHPRFRMVK